VKAAKPQLLDRPSVAAAWWSWWARHRLPSLLRGRLYWSDLDGALWVSYAYEGSEPKLLGLCEVMPLGGSLEVRRPSLAALRALSERSGLPGFIVEVGRRHVFRIRGLDGRVVLGPVGEVGLADWLASLAEAQECSDEMPDWF
jgi:hypothetical protein